MANTDISPELLEEIEKLFDKSFYSDPKVMRIYKKIASGTATYKDAHQLAELTAKHRSKALEKVYSQALEKGILPNNTIYQNIAEKTVIPSLKEDHRTISEACDYIQTDLTRKAGLGISSISVDMDVDRAAGLAIDVANARTTKLMETSVPSLIENFALNVVSSHLEANMNIMRALGLVPTISRMRGRNPNKKCKFCNEREYSGEYKGKNMPEGIFRRHRDCHCIVLYDPKDGSGKVQGAHSKREYANYQEGIKKEREYLTKLDKMSPTERRTVRNARARELRRNQYTATEWENRKAMQALISRQKDEGKEYRTITEAKILEERKRLKGVDIQPKNIILKEKDINNQTTAQLRKGIRSYRKQIVKHIDRIQNPKDFYPEWDSFDKRYQAGLKRHWEKEIKNHRTEIERREIEINKRGE